MIIKNKRGRLAMITGMLCLVTASVMGNEVFFQNFEKTFLKLSLENKNVTDFFKEIEKQTKFTFVYSSDVRVLKKRITIKKNKISVKDALEILVEKANLRYMVSGNTISIKIKKRQLNLESKSIQQKVRGTVTDQNGMPLPGANVLVKNTANGVVTNFDGNYSIDVKPKDILQFSYVGYISKEVLIVSQTTINIALEEDISGLEQIVVIGYGSSSKRELTSSVTSLSASDVLENKPFSNVEQSLNGKLAGVQVIESSGSPGSGVSVRIRGVNSISAGNEPLYIIDGVQVINTEGLNPGDIESISILKDASATSIYGARASNGVVLITTKRGAIGDSSVDFSTYYGEDRIINTLSVLNSEQYIDYVNTARINAGQSPITDPFNNQFNTDWQKELYDPANLQNYQISFKGGSDNGNYYISGGYQNENGTIETTGFKRYSIRANLDRNMFESFKVGTSIALTRTNFDVINDNERINRGGVVLGALQTPPIIPIQNEDGTYPLNPFQALDNPIAIIRGENREFQTYKALMNLYGEYIFPFGMVFKSSFGVDYSNSKFNRFVDPFTTGNGRATEGEAETRTFLETIWTWENTLNYKFTLQDEINFDFLLGTSAQKSRFESTFLLGRGFANSSVTTAEGAAEPIDVGEQIGEWSNNSYFLRTNINYLKKYFLSSSIRTDGSSRFGPGNRYAIFPSISVAWLVSDEYLLKDSSWLTNLKIRYSYGVTGNQFIGNYDWYGLYGLGSNYVINGEIIPGAFPSQVQNEALKWESTKQHNIGIDIGLFSNRITINTDIYHKNTTDMLIFTQLPATTGFGGARQNIGTMTNKGIEVGLNVNALKSPDVSWNINANYYRNINEVTNLNGETIFGGFVNDQGNVGKIEEGEAVGNFFGYVSQGIDPDTGNIIFADLDDNGIINDEDRTIIGNSLPDFSWGVTNTLGYKGFELIAFFQGVEGQDIYNATRFELESLATFKNQSITALDRWTPENRDGTLPIAIFGDPNGNGRASTRWIEDGSYIKLRELTLSYTFPTSWIEKLKLSNLRIYAQGRNLYTWTDYSGYDPEVSRDGGSVVSANIDYGTYPQVKTYIAGLNLSF
ncbi:TonB-dependent receptor [Aquimarina sp. M1]